MSPDLDMTELETRLLRAGIAPRHVRRTVTELREHMEDLVAAEHATGLSLPEARSRAARQMGSLDALVAEMRARPELRSWAHHYPRIAVLVYSLTCIALLPALPVLAGVAHASLIARWSLCLMFGALVTASMFLVLQLSILLA